MENYADKTQAITGLQNRGYSLDFILKDDCLFCPQERELINPDEFEIAETYLFREQQGADETYVIYGIHSSRNGLKGILTTSYSAFMRGLGIHLWCKLSRALR